MTIIIYLIITLYFGFGALATHLTYRKREPPKRHMAWTKFWVYLVIIYGITTLLVFAPGWFPAVAFLIVLIGFFELIRTWSRNKFIIPLIYILILSVVIYGALSAGFIMFSLLKQEYLLFAFFIVTSFDAFSQVMGQLFGKHHIFPRISPAKTLEGLVSGTGLATLTGGLIHSITNFSLWQAIVIALIISVFSLLGDLSASAYKRWSGIKDFSVLIPAHGGILDRFDSLLAGGTVMFLISRLMI